MSIEIAERRSQGAEGHAAQMDRYGKRAAPWAVIHWDNDLPSAISSALSFALVHATQRNVAYTYGYVGRNQLRNERRMRCRAVAGEAPFRT